MQTPDPAAATKRPLTFDGEYTALFSRMWDAAPIFHRFSHVRAPDEGDVSRDLTACGRLVSSYDRSSGKLAEKMTWVPMRHALVFGRPCRRCFPDA